jgi:hypothetical protein
MFYTDRAGNTVQVAMESGLSGITAYLGLVLNEAGEVEDTRVYFEGELYVKD